MKNRIIVLLNLKINLRKFEEILTNYFYTFKNQKMIDNESNKDQAVDGKLQFDSVEPVDGQGDIVDQSRQTPKQHIFEGGTSSNQQNSTGNSQANLLEHPANPQRRKDRERGVTGSRERGTKSSKTRDKSKKNTEARREKSGENPREQKKMNGMATKINGNGPTANHQRNGSKDGIVVQPVSQQRPKKDDLEGAERKRSQGRSKERNGQEKEQKRSRKKEVKKEESESAPSETNEKQKLIDFHRQNNVSDDQDELSSQEDNIEISAIQIKNGGSKNLPRSSSENQNDNDLSLAQPQIRGTPQNEQSGNSIAGKASNFEAQIIEASRPSNADKPQQPKTQKNGKSKNANQSNEKKLRNKNKPAMDSAQDELVFTTQPEKDNHNFGVQIPKKKRQRSKNRQLEESKDGLEPPDPTKTRSRVSKERGQVIESSLFMPEDNSFDHLIPGEENQKGNINGSKKAGRSSTKIAVDSSKTSKLVRGKRKEPIQVNFGSQLQNGHDDHKYQSIEISQDALHNNKQVEEKKQQIWQGVGQKVKQIITKGKKKFGGSAKSQEKRRVSEEDLLQDDQRKANRGQNNTSLSQISKQEQKQTAVDGRKEKKPAQGKIKGEPQVGKPVLGKKEQVDAKVPSPNGGAATPAKPMQLDTDTDDSSKSVTLDPDTMNKDDYFRALKKKQRKKMLLSLKNNVNKKNEHRDYIKNLEAEPRNIMKKIEEKSEEKKQENKTFRQRIISNFDKCLNRIGCKELYQKLFGDESAANMIQDGTETPQLNIIKSRQYQNLMNLKQQEKERSDVERLWKQERIIKLNHPYRVKWDIVIILFTIFCCIELPIEVCYRWRSSSGIKSLFTVLNSFIDGFFAIDIIMNFFTTYFHPTTGEEITEKKEIAINYLKGMFILDLLSTIPLDLLASAFYEREGMQADDLQIISILKIIRVFRLSKLIAFLNATDEIKLNLQLFKTMFLILLYIHILGCAWYFYGEMADQLWVPGQNLPDENQPNFYEYGLEFKFFVSFYTSVLALCGNDIFPVQEPLQYLMACQYLLMGALMQAYMFGNLAVMVQQLNRKSQSFQEKLDLANTSMRNMQLQEPIQNDIRDFMTRTQSNLDNQKELNQFLMLISPTLRVAVTTHIFQSAIAQNEILEGQDDVMDFLINKITPRLKLPEDLIFQQNDQDEKFLCFIARGKCEVSVSNNMKKSVKQKEIQPGDYFGEICLIYDCPRTATVMSMDYSIFAELTQDHFSELWSQHPDFYEKMKQEIYRKYNKDEWIAFKIKLLEQVDYFTNQKKKKGDDLEEDDQEKQKKFFHEIQFFMQEKIFQKGTFIQDAKQRCDELIFVVNGMVEVQVEDQQGDYHTIEQLLQGSIIGQYAVHSQKPMFISVRAATAVRLLTLSRTFFEDFGLKSTTSKILEIEGLEDACNRAQKKINQLHNHFGEEMKNISLPQCDFKLFERMQMTTPTKRRQRQIHRFRNRLIIMHRISKFDFKNMASKLKKQLYVDEQIESIQTNLRDKLQGQLQFFKSNMLPQMANQIQDKSEMSRQSDRQSDGSVLHVPSQRPTNKKSHQIMGLQNLSKSPQGGNFQLQIPSPAGHLANITNKADQRRASHMQSLAVVKTNILATNRSRGGGDTQRSNTPRGAANTPRRGSKPTSNLQSKPQPKSDQIPPKRKEKKQPAERGEQRVTSGSKTKKKAALAKKPQEEEVKSATVEQYSELKMASKLERPSKKGSSKERTWQNSKDKAGDGGQGDQHALNQEVDEAPTISPQKKKKKNKNQ